MTAIASAASASVAEDAAAAAEADAVAALEAPPDAGDDDYFRNS